MDQNPQQNPLNLSSYSLAAAAHLGVVVGHGGEEVVRNVSVCNVVEDNIEGTVATVHGGKGPPQPVPLSVVIVRQRRVRVLQQRDAHQPAIHHQVGRHIHLCKRPVKHPLQHIGV